MKPATWRLLTATVALCIALLPSISALSKPTAILPDISYTTGTTELVTANWATTSPTNFIVNYQTTMATPSLNATLGIMGINYYIGNTEWGWRISIASVTQSFMDILLNVRTSNNPIYYLRICYFVTSNTLLDVNWVSYSFNAASDPIANYSLGNGSCFIDCRSAIKTQSFKSKTAGRVLTMLSGFDVTSSGIPPDSTTYFGLTLEPSQPSSGTASSFSMNITVYGGAEIAFVSFFYISFQPKVINIMNYRLQTDGTNAIGCYYSINTCNPIPPLNPSPNSNSSFSTGKTAVLSYSENNFYIGISRMIMAWAGDASTTAEFNINNIAQNSDSSISVSFAFTGNPNSQFQVAYSYFTLQTFYCPTIGVDIYYVYNSNTCDSSCNSSIQQYANASNYCQPCGTFCWTCMVNDSFCTSCYSNQSRILVNNSCKCDVSAGVYDDGSSVVCPLCHYSCKTCSGGSSTGCITCDSSTQRTLAVNSCPCNIGYFDNGAATCLACHYSCSTATCLSTSSIGCTSCNLTKQRTQLANFSCGCIAGYFDNLTSTEQCSLCHYSCYTCWGTNSLCTSCTAAYNRYYNATENTCKCTPGYYDSGVVACSACYVTCLTCSGPLITNCLTCNTSLGRTLFGSTCNCGLRLYDYNNTCLSCSYTCLTCTSFTATNCITCNSAAFRTKIPANNSCQCNNGYYDAGIQICLPCSASCLTCTISSTMCTSCHNNPGRYFSGSGYSCLCSSGYVDVTFNGVCTLCSYSCLTCSGSSSNNCVLCAGNRLQNGTSCICPDGTYDNGFNATCQPCLSTCLTCISGMSSGCLSCDPAQYRNLIPSTVGSCVCSSSYYDAGILICQPCSPICLTCWGSSSNCSSCDSVINHRLITSNNTCVCASGYVEVGATACVACFSSCLTCDILPNNCTSCSTDRTLSSGVCNCIAGKFLNSSGLCQNCSYLCSTCVGSSTNCTSCPSGSNRYNYNFSCPCVTGYLETNTTFCQPCSYTCQSCNTFATVCASCPANSFRVLNSTLSTCPCMDGYYDNGGSVSCLICSPLCLTCTFYSQCLSCNSSLFRTWNSSTLSCVCNAGYFDNGGLQCVPCSASCATCFGVSSTNCTSCPSNRFLIGNQCVCPNGTYDAGGSCAACSLSCLTCSIAPSNCTSCPTGSYLLSNQCYCNLGYFLNGNTCIQCDPLCYSCSVTSSSCTACNPSQGTILNGTTCLCPSGSFFNNLMTCQTCNSRCLTCQNTSVTCLSCIVSSHRLLNITTWSCDCDPGYFQNNTIICASCAFPCLTCNGGTSLNCTSCNMGYSLIGSSCVTTATCPSYIYQGICTSSCPNTTFTSGSTCVPCINNCLTCSSPTFCTSCKSSYYFYNNTCILTCPSTTYIASSNQSCSPCPTSCLKCSLLTGSLICFSCQSGYYLVNYTCTSVCPLNGSYLLIGQACVACFSPCQTCTNLTSNGCLSCSTGYSFFDGMCLSKCPEGYLSINMTCQPCGGNCSQCNSSYCLGCLTGFYLNQKGQCIQNGYFIDQSGSSIKCHPNCLTCTNSSFSSCVACSQYRGDQSQMAVSGYCDCWASSIDIGNGTCDLQSYKIVQSSTNVLVTFTTSTTYLSALAGVASLNFLGFAMTIFYQQTYSNFYFVNSTAVLQTDLVLQRYGDTSISKFSKGRNREYFGRRLYGVESVHLQDDESLFMRGEEFAYLIDWGFVVTVLTLSFWAFILIMKCILSKRKAKMGNSLTIANKIFDFFNESVIILLIIFTFNEVTLYAFASFKIVFKKYLYSIDYARFAVSALFIIYYIGYLLRMFLACRQVNSNSDKKKFKALFYLFEASKLIRFSSRIYLPILLVRSLLINLGIVIFSYNPIIQSITSLAIILIWNFYSFFSCPYRFFFRVIIRFHELIFTLQILLLTASVTKPEYSRVDIAFGILVLNFAQIFIVAVFSVCVVLEKIYNIKCLKREENSIAPNQASFNEKNYHPTQNKYRNEGNPNIDETLVDVNQYQDYVEPIKNQDIFSRLPTKNESMQLAETTQSIPSNDVSISIKRHQDPSKKRSGDDDEYPIKKRYRIRRDKKK